MAWEVVTRAVSHVHARTAAPVARVDAHRYSIFQNLVFRAILGAMLKPQDIVVLCKLAGREEPWTIASIGHELGLSPSAVHRSLERAETSHLFEGRSRRVNARALDELLVHAVRFLLPGRMSGPTRGIATAWSAEPLIGRMGRIDEDPVVWAHPEGPDRGIELEPIHACAPAAALRDPQLRARLALVDALRIGGARVRREAQTALTASLGGAREPG